jgi:hypothetical protein
LCLSRPASSLPGPADYGWDLAYRRLSSVELAVNWCRQIENQGTSSWFGRQEGRFLTNCRTVFQGREVLEKKGIIR